MNPTSLASLSSFIILVVMAFIIDVASFPLISPAGSITREHVPGKL